MAFLEKVKLSQEQTRAFASWATHEILTCGSDRKPLEEKWKDAIVQHRAALPKGEKQFPWPGAPLARDTEVLTRTGWRRVDSLRVGDIALSRVDGTGELEWVPVQATPRVWADKLYHFKSKSVNMLVTPEHTMVCTDQKGRTHRLTAAALWERTGLRIPLTGRWSGRDEPTLFGLDSGDVAEFFGWFISEGSRTTAPNGTKTTLHIAQSRTANPEKCARLEALFGRLGFYWNYGGNSYTVGVRRIPEEMRAILDEQGTCEKKHIPDFFFDLSPRILTRLLESLILGDGHAREPRAHQNLDAFSYYTTSPQLADQVQIVAQLLGMRASVRSRNRVGMLVGTGTGGRTKRVSFDVQICHKESAKADAAKREIVDYNDYAFCVTVKNHAILVRREGVAAWTGNSNIDFPLTAIHSDPVLADFMQTLHAPAEYWTISANRSDRVDSAQPLTELMKRLEKTFIKMRQVNERALLDNVVLGTAIYKTHWLHERRSVRDYVGVGTDRKIDKKVKTRSHPLVEHIPLQHFYIPADAWNIDPDAPVGGARWVAHRFELTKNALKARAQSETPFVPAYDKEGVEHVLTFESAIASPVDDKIRQIEEFSPFENRKIRLFELWARFDVDGDGIDEDIVAILHPESHTVLRVLYNPFLHGKRPFQRTRFLPYFGFYGMGMAEQDEWAQLTASKILNATIDNVMLANTRMFGVPQGYGMQDTPIFPGKQWVLGPNEQIQEIKLGEVYPSIFNIFGQVLQTSELRTGSSDARNGDISSLPSRTPASSLMEMLRQGNKRFDMIHSDFRLVHDEIGTQTFQNLAQKYLEQPDLWTDYCMRALGEVDAAKVLEVLEEGVHEIPDFWGVSTTATSAMVNKEVEKQSFLGLLQILTQVYSQLIQTAQLLQSLPPGTPTYESASAAYSAGVEFIGRLLEKFDIQNPEKYIGNLQSIAGMLASQGAGQNAALAQAGMYGGGMQSAMSGAPALPGAPAGLGIAPQQIGALFGL